ncbi:MAG TPA: glycerol-3-phosphate dehydrogenase/oxidase [Devosia sp.]
MPKNREEMLADLRTNPHVQAVVVGGGINGISTFRELALQGVRVLLVDREDFCGACSSAPSRMIHGGLRYLENGEIGLVRESLRERDALLRNAPHFVRPLPTTVPIQQVFSGLLNGALNVMHLRTRPAERGALAVKIGLTLYDLLAGKRRLMPKHVFRGRGETAAFWPDLPDWARFSATYYDAWISHPERLAIELVREGLAANLDAVAINHLAVTSRDGRKLALRDALTGTEFTVETDLVINATGAWTDETNALLFAAGNAPAPYVGGTKGSHLVLDHPELMAALHGHMIYFENVDGRVCILFPYLGRVLLGSTDIRVESPGVVRCEDEEVDYILSSLAYVFPGITVKPEHIVYRYSGVRPLPRSEARFTGAISRDHFVAEIPGTPPVLCLVGGKWTTFRAFGEQAADRALALLGVERTIRTAERSIGGGVGFPYREADRAALVATVAADAGVTLARATHAVDHYGTAALEVLAFCAGQEDRVIDGTNYTEAELRHLIRNEFARTLGDLLQRRTSIAITGALTSGGISRAAAILADELGWSSTFAAEHEAAFRERLARDHGLGQAILTERDRKLGSPACA